MASSDHRQSPSPDASTLHLSSEELKKGQGCNMPAVVGSKRAASSTSLSSQSSKGGSERRERKRKARSDRPAGRADDQATPPIRRLYADKSDFKEIVHQFTGNPVPPPPPKLPFVAADSQPQALLAAAITQSLSTLDIISSYLLLQGSSQENFMMLSEINRRKSKALLQVLMNSRLIQGPSGGSEKGTNMQNPSPLSPSLCTGGGDLHHSLSPSLCTGGAGLDLNHLFASQLGKAPHDTLQPSHQSQQVAQLESFLLKGNDKTDSFVSLACTLLKQMASH